MKTPLSVALLSLLLMCPTLAGAPRKGVSYKPTPDGGRACYIDGVFAYAMPMVPKGLWGTTYGVPGTPVLQEGPVDTSDWKDFLQSKGIRFGKGTSATYYAAFGHLVVVNTREQQEVLTQMVTSPTTPASSSPTAPEAPATSGKDGPSKALPQ
jgi:hypothetical protein